jgi:hypothetical protein
MNIHEKCIGCNRIVGERCNTYEFPSIWWDKRGGCPLASHMTIRVIEDNKKLRAGQQKQKKKTRR